MEEMTIDTLLERIQKQFGEKDFRGILGLLAVQIDLKEPEGVFYVEVKNGVLSVEPYEYNDRHAKLIISMENFVKLLDKKLDPVWAFTTGKLKVEGDIGKVLELTKLI